MTPETVREWIRLTKRLFNDLKMLGVSPLELGYNLECKKYSKRFFGRYFPERYDRYKLELPPKVVVYFFKDKELTELYSYQDIFSTTIHEICHHIQYSNPDFVRVKGVMHNKDFWDMWNSYMNKYFELTKESKGGRYYESLKKSIRKGSRNAN